MRFGFPIRAWIVFGVFSAAACATAPEAARETADSGDYSSDACPRRSPAASHRSAIRCIKHVSTYHLDIGAQYPTDGSPLSGFVYTVSCNGGDVFLEDYPMSATVVRNDEHECVIEVKGDASREPASKRKKPARKPPGHDSVAFELTLKSGTTVELGKQHDQEGRFPASAKVSVSLDKGRARVVEETLECDVLYDFVQSLGCRIKKR